MEELPLAVQLRLQQLRSSELLELYVQTLDLLRERRVIRSTNNPVADLAELMAIETLSLEIAPKSTKGFDALDKRGQTYQIKGRRITAHNPSRQLGFLRGLGDKQKPFRFLVGILFDEHFRVLRGCVLPVNTVLSLATYRSRENAWRFILNDAVWRASKTRDITSELRRTHRRLLRNTRILGPIQERRE